MSESRDFAAMTLEYVAPKWPVGTKFDYRKVGEAEVVGYRLTHDTDTGVTKVDYRIAYTFCGQHMTADVVQTTIDRAKWAA